ncbi:helix-turn-helix domain-containing protein [Carboxydochorda subterranea]|uniref:Helix-turn-helix domain-containing protein n=1 Tax=Carboxydichorda subterranea TaxID=3109565 RepID=A0ABZ1BY02_9FIRM|nr:helix-turn-helix domain-containing protein [Limnochorda sp. L945t]WRP17390.1 helix-turn-helix domain-containing protein [Limnochorda sp. L945t]
MLPDLNGDPIVLLQELGLTDYEARVYMALCRRNPLNGHQVARLSGVPSAKVYATLEKLVTRGLVAHRESKPVTYVPLPIEEFLAHRRRRLDVVADQIRALLATDFTAAQAEALWHLKGFDTLMTRAAELLARASAEVLLSLWEPVVSTIRPRLAEAASRGVRVAAIYFDGQGPGVGFAIRHVDLPSVKARHGGQSFLVVDQRMALFISHGTSPEQWQGLWTSNAAMVRAIANYIRHDIYVNKIVRRFPEAVGAAYGEHLDLLLDVFDDRVLATGQLKLPGP